MLLYQGADDLARFVRIIRPMYLAAGFGDVAFKLLQIQVEIAHEMRFDGACGGAQFFPVRQLADNVVSLVADHMRRMAHVVAQLAVFQRAACGLLERGRLSGFANANAHTNGSPSVDASTSAICAVLTPVRPRCSAPKICMRQELSVATHNSAPVSRMVRTLSASMAWEVSAFLTEKVPPKPQHSSLSGRSINWRLRTRCSRRYGMSPSFRPRNE